MRDIEAVRKTHEERLLKLPNVVGVGIGEQSGRPVIKILVTRKVPMSALDAEEMVPRELDGYATDVEEIGVVQAESEPTTEGRSDEG